MKFEDLVFEQHQVLGKTEEDAKRIIAIAPDFEGSKQALFRKGGVEVSILFGKMFYSNGIDTYEVMSNFDEEPIGYISKEKVEAYINSIIVKDNIENGIK